MNSSSQYACPFRANWRGLFETKLEKSESGGSQMTAIHIAIWRTRVEICHYQNHHVSVKMTLSLKLEKSAIPLEHESNLEEHSSGTLTKSGYDKFSFGYFLSGFAFPQYPRHSSLSG
jgi:hypothetical protein